MLVGRESMQETSTRRVPPDCCLRSQNCTPSFLHRDQKTPLQLNGSGFPRLNQTEETCGVTEKSLPEGARSFKLSLAVMALNGGVTLDSIWP